MLDQVVAVFIYATYLFLPGYLVLSAARICNNRFLLSYGISISILTVTLLPFTLFGGNIYLWVGFLHAVIAFLVYGTHFLYKKRGLQRPANRKVRNLEWNWWPLFGFLGLLGSFSLYHLVVGPYTEIPSDFWKHLSRVGIELHSLTGGTLANWDIEGISLSVSSPIYILHAAVAHFLSTSPIELTLSATLVTSIIFLGSVYWFSFKILSGFELSIRYSVAGAILASLLTLVSFGTASFSYVRYYAYFPHYFRISTDLCLGRRFSRLSRSTRKSDMATDDTDPSVSGNRVVYSSPGSGANFHHAYQYCLHQISTKSLTSNKALWKSS